MYTSITVFFLASCKEQIGYKFAVLPPATAFHASIAPLMTAKKEMMYRSLAPVFIWKITVNINWPLYFAISLPILPRPKAKCLALYFGRKLRLEQIEKPYSIQTTINSPISNLVGQTYECRRERLAKYISFPWLFVGVVFNFPGETSVLSECSGLSE